jgi:hypothetical protein
MLDNVSNCIFLTDIALNFCTTFKEEGVWVRSRSAVAYSYATGWFSLDLLSSFPIDWFTMWLGVSGLGSFNKLLRILRQSCLVVLTFSMHSLFFWLTNFWPTRGHWCVTSSV